MSDSEKLSWDEIKRRYPDEWVALVDYRVEGCEMAEGVVVAHSGDRDEMYQQLAAMKLRDCATWYTGRILGGRILVVE